MCRGVEEFCIKLKSNKIFYETIFGLGLHQLWRRLQVVAILSSRCLLRV